MWDTDIFKFISGILEASYLEKRLVQEILKLCGKRRGEIYFMVTSLRLLGGIAVEYDEAWVRSFCIFFFFGHHPQSCLLLF